MTTYGLRVEIKGKPQGLELQGGLAEEGASLVYWPIPRHSPIANQNNICLAIHVGQRARWQERLM